MVQVMVRIFFKNQKKKSCPKILNMFDEKENIQQRLMPGYQISSKPMHN